MSSSVLRKTEKLTLTTPIPQFIAQSLAVSVLHDHSKVITLNPLVTDHVQIQPPKDAPKDEYHDCTWYRIGERIQYVPGLGKMGSGKINFQGCFRDISDGLWTHIYAPMNVDLRAVYRVVSIAGSQSGKLALKADIHFECNVTLAAFVRMQLKASIKEMVEKMIEKAERADAEALAKLIREQETSGDLTMEASTQKIHRLPVQTIQVSRSKRATKSPARRSQVISVTLPPTSPTAAELPSTIMTPKSIKMPAPLQPRLVAELPDTTLTTSRFKSLHIPYHASAQRAELPDGLNGRPERPFLKTGVQSASFITCAASHGQPTRLAMGH